MQFHLAINLERMDASADMREVQQHTLDMVRLADEAGFTVAWAAEHHALEMTIAPNPFVLLGWWAAHTKRIRLGPGVVNAAYWHPIKLAGEAALLDLLSGGRLEFGIGSGAYQREFDRMKPGLLQTDGWRYMQEALPLVEALWRGDVAHEGDYWHFPHATSCPKPLQGDVPIWVAARAPVTFDYAVKNNCNIMSWPLTLPLAEIEIYRERLNAARTVHNPGYRGTFAVMRHTVVYTSDSERKTALDAVRQVLARFGNLMTRSGDVVEGFPEAVSLESLEGNLRVDANMLEENLMFGAPETIIEKLNAYESLGVDAFIYYASLGLPINEQKRSLQRFIDHVLPAFA